jgi:hypothetical protein
MSYYNTTVDDNRTKFKFNIWLVNTFGYVLIDKSAKFSNPIHINNLTLESDNLDDLIKLVETSWGILCSKEDLKLIYSIHSDSEITKGNLLMLNLSWDQKTLIENRCGGKFVNYRELEDKFGEHIEDDNLKESFYSLIAELDNVYGHHNVQLMMSI